MGTVVSTPNSGPFGLGMGIQVTEVIDPKEMAPFVFFTSTVPKPHRMFETYRLVIHPNVGLSMISGISKNYENDKYGINIRGDFQIVRNQLEQVYGRSQASDFIMPGALWEGPENWVAAIRENERVFQVSWGSPGERELRNYINEILFTVNAVDFDTTWFSLQYRFVNWDAYERQLRSADMESL